MHRFDERFARQYRYELPPGFPLALSYPSIVHHLSGPIMHTFTLTLFGRTSEWAGGAAAPKFEGTASHLFSLSFRVSFFDLVWF